LVIKRRGRLLGRDVEALAPVVFGPFIAWMFMV
jgi:hypothetical protein